MAKIIKNANYDAANATADKKGMYLFDAEDGSEVVELVVWLEKSKANDKHPEGKPWIRLPKGNITNRAYFSEDLFNSTAVDGECTVEVKNTPPRVLGTSGVKADIIKYLDEDMATEYTNLVDGAVEKYKAAKANNKKKKLEDMTADELQAYINALKNGEKYAATNDGPKSFMDMFSDDEYTRYNEILAIAQENKANAPKAKRGPLTEEEKAARNEKRKANELTKAEKLLAALQAASVAPAAAVEDDADEDDGYEDTDEVIEDDEIEDDEIEDEDFE